MNLAIYRVNHKISGGWAMTLGLGGGAFVVFLALMLFVIWAAAQGGSARIAPIEPFYDISLILEAGALLLGGPILLANAIRRDRTRGMLESHRMLPMQSSEVLLGYLGALGPVIVFALCNGAFMVVLGLNLGIPLLPLLIALGGFMVDAALIWTITLLWSLIHSQLPSLLVLMLIAGTIGSFAVFILAPGLVPFYLPIFALKAFEATSIDSLAPAALGSFILMLAITGLFFLAATRRFRFPRSLGLLPAPGVIIYLCAIGLTLCGHYLQGDIFTRSFEIDEYLTTSACGTVVLLLLILLCPIIAAARQNADLALPPAARRRIRWQNALLLILAVAATLIAIICVAPPPWTLRGEVAVLLSIAGFAALASAVAALTYRLRSQLMYLWMFLLVAVVMFGPIILYGLAAMVLAATSPDATSTMTVIQGISAISPVGVSILNNIPDAAAPWAGIIILWSVAGISWLTMLRRRSGFVVPQPIAVPPLPASSALTPPPPAEHLPAPNQASRAGL